jgi:hypothetical protein
MEPSKFGKRLHELHSEWRPYCKHVRMTRRRRTPETVKLHYRFLVLSGLRPQIEISG